MSPHQTLQQALAYHRVGRLPEAEALYRALLHTQPAHAEANHHLGMLLGQVGQIAISLPYLKAALDADPAQEYYWRAYAETLLASGQAKAAHTLLQKAVQNGFKSPAVQALRQQVKAAVQAKPTKVAAPTPTPDETSQIFALFNAKRYWEVEHRSRLLLEQYPDSGFFWNTLGTALMMQGKDSLPTLRKATEFSPTDASAHSNLSSVLRELGQLDAARASCLKALEIDPNLAEAYANWVNIVFKEYLHTNTKNSENSELKRTLPSSSCGKTLHCAPHVQNEDMISVIICSINDKKFAAVSRMYEELLANTPFEIIRIGDAQSLCEGYNRGLRQSKGDLLIFSHDDIKIISPDFNCKLRRHLADYDLIGIAGTTHLIKGSWLSAGWPYQRGWVTHPMQSEEGDVHFVLSIFGVWSSVAENIQAVDGLFFAVRRQVAEQIQFDETTFDNFHFYDLDFSYRAYLAGYKLAVCNDLKIIHDSTGNFNSTWASYAEKFYKKHNATLPSTVANEKKFPSTGIQFTTQEQIIDFCNFFILTSNLPQPD
jgi:tetratricopeptide (TPR) repeat protein